MSKLVTHDGKDDDFKKAPDDKDNGENIVDANDAKVLHLLSGKT